MNTLLKMIFWISILTVLLCGCDVREQPKKEPVSEIPAITSVPPVKTEQPEVTIPSKPALSDKQTIASIRGLLGEPDGEMTLGERTILLYSGEALEFTSGKWTNPQPDIQEKIAAKKKPLTKQVAVQAAPAEKKPAVPPPVIVRPFAAPVTENDPSEYSALLIPGKITVIDFYATWCGPCKQLAPILDDIIRKQPNTVLRKVNIGNWGSSIAKKYNITSVPNVRVFDKNGHMVGTPTSRPDQITKNIEEAQTR